MPYTQPDGGTYENCGAVYLQEDGAWGDLSCHSKAAFICDIGKSSVNCI